VDAALTARFRGLPHPFYALFGATLVNRLGGVVQPFLALYLAHRDLPVAQIGLIVALSGAGSLLGQLAGGVVADRVWRREAFAVGMAGAAASFGLLGAAQATWLLVLGGFLAGGVPARMACCSGRSTSATPPEPPWPWPSAASACCSRSMARPAWPAPRSSGAGSRPAPSRPMLARSPAGCATSSPIGSWSRSAWSWPSRPSSTCSRSRRCRWR